MASKHKGIYLKLHRSPNSFVAAVCDEELVGKKFEDNERCINISGHFYKGKIKPEEEIIDCIKDAPTINFVGERSVALGIKEGLIEESHVIKIKNIPHAICIML